MARAAALSASLDIRPLSFCDYHAHTRHFAQAIFEMGQTIPINVKIYTKFYLAGRTAVTCALKDLTDFVRQESWRISMTAYCV